MALARIDLSAMRPAAWRASQVTGACDVDNPLTGPSGASAVYGPQKGASADDVAVLDRALGHLAAVVERDLGDRRSATSRARGPPADSGSA